MTNAGAMSVAFLLLLCSVAGSEHILVLMLSPSLLSCFFMRTVVRMYVRWLLEF